MKADMTAHLHHRRVLRQDPARVPFRGREERIDVDLLEPRLLDDKLIESDQQFFQRADINRRASAEASQRTVNLGPFPSSATGPEEQHRTKLADHRCCRE